MEDLRQFVEIPLPKSISEPDTGRTVPSVRRMLPALISACCIHRFNLLQAQVDFESLRAVNPKVEEWLTIDGTNISYPIAQYNDK